MSRAKRNRDKATKAAFILERNKASTLVELQDIARETRTNIAKLRAALAEECDTLRTTLAAIYAIDPTDIT